MKSILLSIPVFILLSLTPLFATDFVDRQSDGTLIYKCSNCCDKVRIYKLGKGRYRVYSIAFAGIIQAESPLEAARVACKGNKTESNSTQSE